MATTVIYVHGNGNQAPPDRLKAEWDKALFGQDMGARSRVAYWASVRYPQPLPEAESDEIDRRSVSPSGGLEELAPAGLDPVGLQAEAQREAFEESRAAAGGDLESVEERATDLDPWLERMAYQADALVEGEDATAGSAGLEAFPLPRDVRIAIFRALVKVAFKDVYAYFFGGDAEPMRAILRAAIAQTTGPVVVVSHSLGTVIAYDVLREAALAGREVPLFVTAGSPLAVQEVQDLVVQPLLVPAGVTAWRNVADARDLVALDNTIRPEYDPPARCSDFLVVNDSDSHHSIREYLSTAPIRDAVTPFFP